MTNQWQLITILEQLRDAGLPEVDEYNKGEDHTERYVTFEDSPNTTLTFFGEENHCHPYNETGYLVDHWENGVNQYPFNSLGKAIEKLKQLLEVKNEK